MNGSQWVIVAYVVGLGLLWGHALLLWLALRKKTNEGGNP